MSTLLVIGNGFDLKLKAKTRYQDFFESSFYSGVREKLDKWKKDYKHYQSGRAPMADMSNYDFSCWDLLFYLVSVGGPLSQNEDIKWCDIEQVIHDSLTQGINMQGGNGFSFSWKNVKSLLSGDLPSDPSSDYYEQMISLFIKTRHGDNIILYDLLQQELTTFEKLFGRYIVKAISAIDYQEDAIELANQLCGPAENIYIDSFNYSGFSYKTVVGSWSSGNQGGDFHKIRGIRHINGNCSNPIFGIDLSEKEKGDYPECIRYTKTARRLQQDSHHLTPKTKDLPESINHAVVFGHSLNEMDYDYFNYLFTMLNFNSFELEKMGCIEFVYSIYNPQMADKIRSDYADKIHKLIAYYEGYISGMNRKILANFLRFSGKLKILEL